jgi:hypothetical protein
MLRKYLFSFKDGDEAVQMFDVIGPSPMSIEEERDIEKELRTVYSLPVDSKRSSVSDGNPCL